MNRMIAAALAAALSTTLLPATAQRAPAAPFSLSGEDRVRLDERERALEQRLRDVQGKPYIADAAVFLHVARMADRLGLYGSANEVASVLRGLQTGLVRCESLANGEHPWTTQPGRSLRGYYSRIDGSVQPYGVVLPAGFDATSKTPMRLDVVLHGRGPTEVTFLQSMEPANPGRAPEQPFIELQPFGRANNGWRWAGETDVFEALEQVREQYHTDLDQTILRGFSMGGHGAWQIGVHYPGEWAAVSPGAGFTDTRKYLKITGAVPAYQEKAWHIYDAVDYALNLFDTPFVAYGGELDPQLQASLNMKDAAAKEGLPFNLIVGPKTQHAYEPNSLREIMRQLATHRRDPASSHVRFATWTLKYNQCRWVTIDGLQEHYRRALVDADAAGPLVTVRTENVSALTLGPLPHAASGVEIDGQTLRLRSSRGVQLVRNDGRWSVDRPGKGLRKVHDLQGPIDDAFMERFLVVRGTGTPWSSEVQEYADAALDHFQDEWRLGFRAHVPIKDDQFVTQDDWNEGNLVLFGDPGSNSVLAKIAPKLPIRWERDGIRVGDRKYDAGHVPVLIYPNPLNPEHYVVINSGHTFNQQDILASNAYLFPKLPDWAVLKLGGAKPEVVAADFFDERWRLKRER